MGAYTRWWCTPHGMERRKGRSESDMDTAIVGYLSSGLVVKVVLRAALRMGSLVRQR